jgi:hypothetical protein
MHTFQQLKDAKKARPPPALNALIHDRLLLEKQSDRRIT